MASIAYITTEITFCYIAVKFVKTFFTDEHGEIYRIDEDVYCPTAEDDIDYDETLGVKTFTAAEMLNRIWWVKPFTYLFRLCGAKCLKNDK